MSKEKIKEYFKDLYKPPIITKIINRNSNDNYKLEEKDGGLFINYQQKIISQIVKARDNAEMNCICQGIQEFIEKENIDTCIVLNKDEIIDCLKGHQKLKMQIADLEAKLAESEKKYNELKEICSRLVEKYEKFVKVDDLEVDK